MNRNRLISAPVVAAAFTAAAAGWLILAKSESGALLKEASLWRTERRIIDLHMHIDGSPERFDRAIRIMDRSGIGIGVNLSGGTVTR